MLFADDPKANLGLQQTINLWVPNSDPDWKLRMKPDDINGALLVATIIQRKWNSKINLIGCVNDLKYKEKALDYLENVKSLARLNCQTWVLEGDFESNFKVVPQSDLDIMAMPKKFSFLVCKTNSRANEICNTFCLGLKQRKRIFLNSNN
ncbi:MAG: hypothetical protein H6625_04800 [Bdellovibrionaceae bacterium]|nr:hypothetical protein [Pseudobdellovibrionaceae bacterium]